MKKNILVLNLVVAGFFLTNFAQAQSFNKGDINVGAGVGIGSALGGGLPIAIHAEYGVTEDISAGAYGAFASYTNNYLTYKYKWTYTIIGARASYHFNKILNTPDNFDIYGGLGLYNYGVNVTSNSDVAYGGSFNDGIQFGIHAGARYYFKDNLAAFVDLGNGIAYLQVGISYKL